MAYRFLFLIVLFFPVVAFAQQTPFGKTHFKDELSETVYSTVQFEALADRAIADRPADFSFRHLRTFYIGAAQYQAHAADIIRQMLNHAYIVQTSENWLDVDDALKEFHKLVRDHLANIGVIEQALALARQDERFGDPALYEWVLGGLTGELLKSGDGRTPRGAYDIITVEEQDLLLRQLGYQVVSAEVSHSGVLYYNILEVEDVTTGESRTLFLDATYPMTKLEKDARQPAFAVDIQRQ